MMSVFKSNIFKGFLFVAFVMCDCMSGVSGGKSITISGPSGRNKFLNMTKDSLKNVTDINFEGQTVDDTFRRRWEKLELDREMDMLSFKDCRFLKNQFYIFSSFPVKHLILNNCKLSAEDVGVILGVDPYVIRKLDLSNNNLRNYEEELEAVFLDKLTMTRFAMDLILKDNNLSENFKSSITENEDYDGGVNFIFN